jgi:hypothetical protein
LLCLVNETKESFRKRLNDLFGTLVCNFNCNLSFHRHFSFCLDSLSTPLHSRTPFLILGESVLHLLLLKVSIARIRAAEFHYSWHLSHTYSVIRHSLSVNLQIHALQYSRYHSRSLNGVWKLKSYAILAVFIKYNLKY